MKTYEIQLRKDLLRYLLSVGEADERVPECPDLEDKWTETAREYMGDGIREFQQYPTASLGWMMYIGMAMAKFWDENWEHYSQTAGLYEQMRDRRGYDHLDEYIRQEVLLLEGEDYDRTEQIVGECASRTWNLLRHQAVEPGTREAFETYVASLHQLYLAGIAMQLKRMGYHMTKL